MENCGLCRLNIHEPLTFPARETKARRPFFDSGSRICQSASKIHPLSASNFDPPGGVNQRLACPALAG
ncbi:hypothetical protein ACDY97_08385, partial [Rhizobium mongolense]|uniref:hypothetical protein n=1 Tax=Rhizobium mongolense TaxID=57676 RepID=UPI003556FD47